MGINPDDEFHTPEGRPIKIVYNGTPIAALLYGGELKYDN
jgi:hypothetical protein